MVVLHNRLFSQIKGVIGGDCLVDYRFWIMQNSKSEFMKVLGRCVQYKLRNQVIFGSIIRLLSYGCPFFHNALTLVY